jgi:hypothetical protein
MDKPNIGRLKNTDTVRVRYRNGYETQHIKEIANRLRRRGAVEFIDINPNPPRREIKLVNKEEKEPVENTVSARGRRPGVKSDETKTPGDKAE